MLRALLAVVLAGGAWLQAVKGKVPPDAAPPPLQYHGLIPGLSTAEDVRRALGPPAHEARWYAWKMLYPAEGRAGFLDAVYLHGPGGMFANAEAASVPKGFENEAAIRSRLGEPEYELRMATFRVSGVAVEKKASSHAFAT